jgi:methyl acetate hydrolase
MSSQLKADADRILHKVVEGSPCIPGVIAMATNRQGNIYEGAAGVRAKGTNQPMTTDTAVRIFSCTKAVTGLTAMQLVEEGKIKLSDPVKEFVPDIADIPVLEGFERDGTPRTRRAKTDITLDQLLTHTAGFGYDFLSHEMLRYNKAKGIPGLLFTNTRKALKSVLLFEPGERWNYGINIDWVGLVVEAIRGKCLGEVMKERVFDPLEMNDTGFVITPAMRPRLAKLHQRWRDGEITVLDRELPQEADLQPGGHGLYSTLADYMKFIRMILNDGAGPKDRMVKPETVARMAKNGLPGHLKVERISSSDLTTCVNDAEFFPGVLKTWSYTFMVNEERAPTGRTPGSLAWCGVANIYFWIDRTMGLGGMWAAQIFPFGEEASYLNYLDFETSIYRNMSQSSNGE